MARRLRLFRQLACGLWVVLLFAPACGSGPAASRPPNIVLIIGDDHGWPYSGFMGDAIVRTPNLDALAREGVVFRNGFATASTCRPSLRSLLTGLDPLQWNARSRALRRQGSPAERLEPIRGIETLPRLLAERGYASFQAGKYWEPSFEGGGFTHGTKQKGEKAPPGQRGWIQVRAGGSGLAIGRSTMQPLWDFLDGVGDRRFFVWFAPSLPHTPHDPPPEFLERYAGPELSPAARAYYANVTRFDAVVGEVVAGLAARDLLEETLLVYLSDNGWEQEPGAPNPQPELGGPHGKSSMYELGFRTPIVFRWPARIPGGRERADLVSALDLFPTLLGFAGIDAPADRPGLDLRPTLLRDEPHARSRVIGAMGSLRPPPATEAAGSELVRFERAYFLRDASWRYIWYAQGDRFGDRTVEELYRIDRDPREANDVAGAHPELTQRYRAEIERWLEETQADARAGTRIGRRKQEWERWPSRARHRESERRPARGWRQPEIG